MKRTPRRRTPNSWKHPYRIFKEPKKRTIFELVRIVYGTNLTVQLVLEEVLIPSSLLGVSIRYGILAGICKALFTRTPSSGSSYAKDPK